MQSREERIGFWISATAHLVLIVWALIGGVLLSPQPSATLRTTEVTTMSGAEFEAYARQARGSGPVDSAASNVAEIDAPDTDSSAGPAPTESTAPPTPDASQELDPPASAEAEPDLSDFESAAPVDVVTQAPQAQQAPQDAAQQPTAPAESEPPASIAEPQLPQIAEQDPPAAPEPTIAIENAPRPLARPDSLVERLNARAAEQERQAAEAEAERERLAAEAEAEAERQRVAEEEAARAAEQERQAAEAEAERERLAAEAEAEAEAEAARQSAIDSALEQAQSGTEGESADTPSGEGIDGNRQRIEGESGTSVEQDPLAAALSEALSGGGQAAPEAAPEPAPEEPEPSPEPAVPGSDLLEPVPITPQALPDSDQGANAEDQLEGAAPLGQPLTVSEREAFRVALQSCWNRGALSLDASQMAIAVGFRLGPDGRPDPASTGLEHASDGPDLAVQQAYEVARRAILMCGRAGYPLPPEKFGRWQNVIVEFRPDGIALQ